MINKNVQELILTEFGMKAGMRMIGAVLPNIVADFEKTTLANALAGREVSEDYRFDDREGGIKLYGIRNTDGTTRVTAVEVHGKKVDY